MTSQKQKTVVSGIQPSGTLHVGNYLGAVRNWLHLQEDPAYRCYFFIADWHSMTVDYDPAEKRRQVLNLAADLLALGIDPEKVTIFRQSDITEHAELAWIFNTVTPVSLLRRMTQFKDKMRKYTNENDIGLRDAAKFFIQGNTEEDAGLQKAFHEIDDELTKEDQALVMDLLIPIIYREIRMSRSNAGLLTYPVLQAADILMYKGDLVPVGVDQIQHVELTRDIAGFFNNRFGKYFPETKPYLTNTPKVRSLTEPTRKMSKSHGDKSCLYLTDDFETVFKKVKGVPTEATGVITMTEREVEEAIAALGDKEPSEQLKGMAGVWNLLGLIREFGSREEAERLVSAQPLKYGELKRLAATRVAEHFAVFQKARADLAADPEKVEHILEKGAAKARAVAVETMGEVRKLVGLR
jgi:tryptophanyl-tRNA synthetase